MQVTLTYAAANLWLSREESEAFFSHYSCKSNTAESTCIWAATPGSELFCPPNYAMSVLLPELT